MRYPSPTNYASPDMGGRIRLARKAAHLTQDNLAAILRVSNGAISSWETGASAPTRARFQELAQILECDPAWLLTGVKPNGSTAPIAPDYSKEITEIAAHLKTLLAHIAPTPKVCAASKSRSQIGSKCECHPKIDGRSLRATGRDQHLNFRCSKTIKAAIQQHVPKGGISLWLEEAIIEKLKKDGFDLTAKSNGTLPSM